MLSKFWEEKYQAKSNVKENKNIKELKNLLTTYIFLGSY